MATKRVILGDCSDERVAADLLAAIHQLGGRFRDGEAEGDLGSGLHHFRLPAGEVSVFVDAWEIDLAGPVELVEQILAALAAPGLN